MAEEAVTGKLVAVYDPGPAIQREANRLVPLGWCNACVGEAKLALGKGEQPGQIDAAVCQSPSQVQQNVMGQTMIALIPLGVCWRHVSGKKPSSLLEGAAG